MELSLLTKKQTEQLEETTIPIESLTTYSSPFEEHYFRINRWYTLYGLTVNSPQKDFVQKLTQIIGYAPVYYMKYEYRSAVWGLKWEEQEFVLYRSEKGISVQLQPDFPQNKLEHFLLSFSVLLKTNQLVTPYEK